MTQPRVSDLKRGKINVFGLDALVNMAAAAGLHIEMRVCEPGVLASIRYRDSACLAWRAMLAGYSVMSMPPLARMTTTAQAGSFHTLSKRKPVSASVNSRGPRMALVQTGW